MDVRAAGAVHAACLCMAPAVTAAGHGVRACSGRSAGTLHRVTQRITVVPRLGGRKGWMQTA